MAIRGIEQLFKVVDAYAAATGLPDKTISSRVLNDSSRILLLRNGGDIGVRKVALAIQWFSENWPPDAEWPSEIDRPSPSPPTSPDQDTDQSAGVES